MSNSYRFIPGRVVAVALAIILLGYGVPVTPARAAQKICAEQQTQACGIDPHAQHEADEARERALAKQQKEAAHAQHEAEEARERALARQQKEAEHAQHEAEEARAREQKEAAHAQHEAAEACERNQKAYAHAQHEADEAQLRADAKLAKAKTMTVGMCTATTTCAEKTFQPEIIRTKPVEPEPASPCSTLPR
jgi:hypothetical protein